MSWIFKRQEEKLLRNLAGENRWRNLFSCAPIPTPSFNLELIKGAVMETLKTKHSLNYLTSGTGNTSFDLQGLSSTKARGNIRLLIHSHFEPNLPDSPGWGYVDVCLYCRARSKMRTFSLFYPVFHHAFGQTQLPMFCQASQHKEFMKKRIM